MKKQSILLAISSLIICLFSHVTFSQEQYFIGCIDNMRGDVQVFKTSKNLWIPAQKLIPVEEKDIIKTGRLSFCQLILDDGSAFRLDADSQLNLESLKIEKKDKAKVQTYHLKLDFGVLLSVFNKKSSQGAKFKVRTPVAVMSIRGTDFAVSVKGNDTKVGLFEGDMAVSSADNENQEVALKPDQEASISKGKEPMKQEFLSSGMQKEKARCQKLREYAEKIRKKLDERDNYLQDRIKMREKRIDDWDKKRREKLDGTSPSEEKDMDNDTDKTEAPAQAVPEPAPPIKKEEPAATEPNK